MVVRAPPTRPRRAAYAAMEQGGRGASTNLLTANERRKIVVQRCTRSQSAACELPPEMSAWRLRSSAAGEPARTGATKSDEGKQHPRRSPPHAPLHGGNPPKIRCFHGKLAAISHLSVGREPALAAPSCDASHRQLTLLIPFPL